MRQRHKYLGHTKLMYLCIVKVILGNLKCFQNYFKVILKCICLTAY